MENCNVEYRKAKLEDDISAIAKYIYLTDPYIYPTICKSPQEKEWVELIRQCYQQDDNLFSWHNIYVALMDGEIIGICCIIPCGIHLKFNEDLELNSEGSLHMAKAVDGYFAPLLEESAGLSGYNVVNLCIDKNLRGRGLGRGLLQYCLSDRERKLVYLDVIADNFSAISLYKSLEFKIEKEYEGFSGKSEPITCYQMKRSIC
jgi:ribosomal protein S18 acetylase RimI-like enzyme